MVDHEIKIHSSTHMCNQPNEVTIDTGHFLGKHSALLERGKDRLAQCQDNVTVWDIGSCYWWYGSPSVAAQ